MNVPSSLKSYEEYNDLFCALFDRLLLGKVSISRYIPKN